MKLDLKWGLRNCIYIYVYGIKMLNVFIYVVGEDRLVYYWFKI